MQLAVEIPTDIITTAQLSFSFNRCFFGFISATEVIFSLVPILDVSDLVSDVIESSGLSVALDGDFGCSLRYESCVRGTRNALRCED